MRDELDYYEDADHKVALCSLAHISWVHQKQNIPNSSVVASAVVDFRFVIDSSTFQFEIEFLDAYIVCAAAS